MDNWIKVEDSKKPNHTQNVLACNAYGACFVVWWDAHLERWLEGVHLFEKYHSYPITHWQPLPEPPK